MEKKIEILQPQKKIIVAQPDQPDLALKCERLEHELALLKAQQTGKNIPVHEVDHGYYTQKEFKKVITDHIARSYPNNRHQPLSFYEENTPFIDAVKSKEFSFEKI